jgi:hypothetical protein
MRTRFYKEEIFVSAYDDPLIVEFYYYPGSPGSMYKKNGDPGDPPEDEEVEVLSARIENSNGRDVYDELSDEDKGMIDEAASMLANEDRDFY